MKNKCSRRYRRFLQIMRLFKFCVYQRDLREKNLTFAYKTADMEIVSDILKITIPALLVFLTAWILLRNMIRNDQDKRRQEIILQGSRTVTPIKLQAYERIVLFLERISMESLLVRVNTPEMSAAQLHSALLTTIRNEFEHNLSQQIYMSPQAWEVVKNARSNTVKIINNEAETMKPDASAIDLSRQLLNRVMELEKEPTRVAIEFIKQEVSRMI
jgi:MFS superfamily sulfate permease-like transporter